MEVTPDPRCDPRTLVYCREEALLARCQRGYRVGETICATPTKCFVTGGIDGRCLEGRPGVACFDASVLLGDDAESRPICAVRDTTASDDRCPSSALPGVPGGNAPGCCLLGGRCGILLQSAANDGMPIGCVDPARLGKPSPGPACDAMAEGGTAPGHDVPASTARSRAGGAGD
jgi:hypothetical protein